MYIYFFTENIENFGSVNYFAVDSVVLLSANCLFDNCKVK